MNDTRRARTRRPPGKPPKRGQKADAPAKPGMASRALALDLLTGVLDRGQPLDGLLATSVDKVPPRDRALARAMVGTTLRRLGEIDAVLDRTLERRPPRTDLVRILQLAAAQILFMEVADHAAVSIAVDQVAATPKLDRFRGLANAVLRRIGREKATLTDGLDPARLDTPDWLWQRWTAAYGETTAREIAAANMTEPYLDLTAKTDASAVAEAVGGTLLPNGTIRFVPSGPVEQLPGFGEGAWWVQDAAASLPARLLGEVHGKRVADLCAAPGGKTAQLAAAGAQVTAVDAARQRLARLSANLERLGLAAEIVAADVLTWRPSELFDAILLDAPCSSTGTIRRHPDVARLKKPEDIAALAATQAKMIDHAATLLKPGGILVYCTCSLEPEEGENHTEGALRRTGLRLDPVRPDELPGFEASITGSGTVRTLPGHVKAAETRLSGLDGFFMMRLVR